MDILISTPRRVIDVLFVNGGIAKNVPLAEPPESTFDEGFDINIKGMNLLERM